MAKSQSQASPPLVDVAETWALRAARCADAGDHAAALRAARKAVDGWAAFHGPKEPVPASVTACRDMVEGNK